MAEDTIDLGGNTLIVKEVLLADKPHQTGEAIPGASDTPTFTTITLGETTLNETDLIALLALLET